MDDSHDQIDYTPRTIAVELFLSYLQDLLNGGVLPHLFSRDEYGRDVLDDIVADAVYSLQPYEEGWCGV